MASGPGPSKKRCVGAHYYYFGTCFFHIEAKDVSKKYVPLSEFKEISPQMEKVIRDDLKSIHACCLGGKQEGYCAGNFSRVDKKAAYIYRHGQHAARSKTKYSQILSTSVKYSEEVDDVAACSECDHSRLLPFYLSNGILLKEYGEEFADLKDLTFESPYFCTDDLPNNWEENDWTKRLVPGIAKAFPDRNVKFTATMGTSWFTEFVSRCLRVEMGVEKYFLFHGCPDVIINKKATVVTAGRATGAEEESSEDDLVENSHQPNPMKGVDKGQLPEKLGEVFAGLHILLVSKILRTIAKEKVVDREYKVKGILIDKVSGGILCSLSVELKDDEVSALNLKVTNCYRGLLAAPYLCSLLKKLMSD